jgi:Tfp pilus assembly protein FimT
MKITPSIFSPHRRQHGSAVLVFVILLAIMMLLAAANSSTLLQLRYELNLLDHRQVGRLNTSQTNATATAVSPARRESK